MMESSLDPGIESQIREWRAYLTRRQTLTDSDVDELEDHLRNEMSDLGEAGLSAEESFLVALKRLGSVSDLSREFARERSSRLWKQLVLAGDSAWGRTGFDYRALAATLGFAIAAAAAFKVPAFFGINPFDSDAPPGSQDADIAFYQRNAAILALPFLVGFLGWRRSVPMHHLVGHSVPFVAAALFMNLVPFERNGDTVTLAAIHLPVVLWLTAGVAYLGGSWRRGTPRMDFVRFTGEWFIYYTLVALGGGVLCAMTIGLFEAIGIDAEPFVTEWILPCGAVGAVIVVAWLVEAKQSVIENMAPVLTGVFTPLFALMLAVAVVGMIVTGNFVDAGRDVLIVLDLLLVVVVGLVLYSISARDSGAQPGPADAIQLVLVTSALLIDLVALVSIAGRISEFGWTPNRTAGLGLNIVLLGNLLWTAFLLAAFLARKRPFGELERWQAAYLPVYGLWAVAVIAAFPFIFQFA